MSTKHPRYHVLQWVFALLGLLCLAWYGGVTLQTIQYQRKEADRLTRMLESQAEADRPTRMLESQTESPTIESQSESPTIDRPRPATPPSGGNADHQLIGRLEIPRLKLSVMVVDGDDRGTLQSAAGHLPDTPLPWEFGNSAVAAHRDSFFRPLAAVKPNDRLVLTTPHGTFRYAVSKIRVVDPNDLSVLAQTGRSSLTLVTCYPFSYVGRAPRRFVVRADHVPG